MRKELKLLIPKEQNLYYKNNPEYFDYIFNLIQDHPLSFFNMLRCNGIHYTSNGKTKYKKYDPIKDKTKYLAWINEQLPMLSDNHFTVSTKCYWIMNGLVDFPKCAHCGKDAFRGKNIRHIFGGYPKFCCVSCSSSDIETQNKVKATCLVNYGVDNYSKTEEYLIREKATKLRKYGNPNFVNSKKAEQTRREKNNGAYESEETRQLRKKLSLERHGVENPMQDPSISKKVSDKRKAFSEERKAEVREKNKKIWIQNYGVDHPSKCPAIRKKIKATTHKHWGVDNYTKTQEFKDKYKDPEFSKQVCNKVFDTKKRNGTFNTSKPEEKAFVLLQKVFPDLVRQYRSDKYPFHCDFYSPSFDLYLEYNGTWTHGGHEFDSNDPADVAKLNKWKAKDTKYYINAVKTWSDLDKRKFEIARRNNLNYIVFWNMNEVEKYVSEFLSKLV